MTDSVLANPIGLPILAECLYAPFRKATREVSWSSAISRIYISRDVVRYKEMIFSQ